MDTLLTKYVFNFTNSCRKPIFFANLLCKKNKVHLQVKAEKHFLNCNKTESQLIQEIADSITYKSDNFIVTSKPYGLCSVTKKSLERNSQNISKERECYIEDLLPSVAAKLGYDSLTLVKAPEKYSSGVMFLSTSHSGADEVLNGISYIKRINLYNYTYLTVTEQPTILKQLDKKLAVERVKCNTETVPIVIEKWSKKQVKKKKIETFNWNHKVIAESDLASLVLVNVNRFQAFYIKLVLATKCYSPVLGDNIFRHRVKNLCGVLLLDDPKNCSKSPQKLNPQLLSAIQVLDNEINIIPTHIHLYAVQLQLGKNKILTSVPPPESFNWTCKQLGLIYDNLKAYENA